MKQFSTRTITIIISLIVLALLALGVFVTQKDKEAPLPLPIPENQENQMGSEETITETIDTSDWKTYRNEEYGFEVRYPADIYNIKEDDSIPMVSFNAVTRKLKERYGDIQVYIAGSSENPLDEADKKSIIDNYRLVTFNNKEIYYSEMKYDCSTSSLREYCHVPGSFFFISGEEYLNVRRITFSDVNPPERMEPVFVNFVLNIERF